MLGENSLLMMVDMHGYDGSPPLAMLSMQTTDLGIPLQLACATICHDTDTQLYITAQVCQKVHALATSKALVLPGFPDIAGFVAANRVPLADPRASLQLKVTVFMPGANALIIQDRLLEKWSVDERRASAFAALLRKHNAEFNPCNVTCSTNKRIASESADAPDAKRICLVEDDVKTWDKLMAAKQLHPN